MRTPLSVAAAAVIVVSLTGASHADPSLETSVAPATGSSGEIVSLGTPLEDVLLIGGDVGPGPDGSTVLWSVSSGAPAHLNAVDPVTGEAVARYDLPGAGGAWAVDAGPDGSVYVGSYGDGRLYRWTQDDGVVDLGRPIASENFIWDVTVADDGIVYGGTYPGGRLFAYDPDTGDVRDYGRLTDGHDYLRSLAVHDGTVYAGTEPPGVVVAVDVAGGDRTTLPTPNGLDPTDVWAYDVDVVGDHLYARFSDAFPGPLHVWDLVSGQWVDTIDNAHGLEPAPADDEGGVHLIVDGELVRYDPADGSIVGTDMPFTGRVANTRGIGWAELGLPDYPGRSIVGLLWRGMMFRYNPTTGAHDFVQTTVEGEPIDITAMSEGPDGRLYTGGFLNGGFAAIDPETGERDEFHTFSQSEGMTSHDGRLVIGAYPDARIYGYDPSLPWNSSEYSPAPEPGLAENPERLVDFKADQQIRPRGLVSAGDYLAIGTMPDLGHLGGVLALYDTAGGELVHSERNLIEDESIVALAYRDGVVYGSTSIFGGQNATPPTQPEATVFAWSVADRELLWESNAIPGAAAINAIAFDDSARLWGVAGDRLAALDPASGEVVEEVSLGSDTGSSGYLAFNEVDGKLYVTPANRRLVSVDPATLAVDVVRDSRAQHVTAHSNGDVYVSAGHELLRYRPRCTETVSGVHFGALRVESGTTCLVDAQVHGAISVTAGAGLVIEGDTTVNGSLALQGAAPVSIVGATIRGSVHITGSPGPAPVVSGSTITGALACSDNAEAPTDAGVPNTVRGARSGQCAAL